MTQNRRRALVAIPMLLAATLSGVRLLRAQSFVPAAGQSFYLDLDTYNGHASAWRHSDLAMLTALRATVSVPRIGQDPNYLPAFTIALEGDATASGGNGAGVECFAQNNQLPIICRVVEFKGGTTVEDYKFQETLNLSQKVDIEISWATTGSVIINFGSESYTAQVAWSVASVSDSSSTDELIADPITFGSLSH